MRLKNYPIFDTSLSHNAALAALSKTKQRKFLESHSHSSPTWSSPTKTKEVIKQSRRVWGQKRGGRWVRKHCSENSGFLAMPTFPRSPSPQLLWKSRRAGRAQYSKNRIKLSNDWKKSRGEKSDSLKAPFVFQFTADWRDCPVALGGKLWKARLSHHLTLFTLNRALGLEIPQHYLVFFHFRASAVVILSKYKSRLQTVSAV